MSKRMRATLLGAAIAMIVAAPASGSSVKLIATVGPGSTISVTNSKGSRASSLKAGPYVVVVRDRSRTCNFHLIGQGAGGEMKTGRRFVGTTRWSLYLRPGIYRYRCDSDPRLRGSFRVR